MATTRIINELLASQNRVMRDDEVIPGGDTYPLNKGWQENHLQIAAAICYHAKDINTAMCHAMGLSQGQTTGFLLLHNLKLIGGIQAIKDLKQLLKNYQLQGLIDIYLSSSANRFKEIEVIFKETEDKLRSIFTKINEDGDDLKTVRKALKNHISGKNWKEILHRLIMEGTVKIGDDAVPSFYALLMDRNLSKYILLVPNAQPQQAEIQAAPLPPQPSGDALAQPEQQEAQTETFNPRM